jgi:predicted nucleotidyltransferase
MTDWSPNTVQEFMSLTLSDEPLRILVGRIVLDRLPFTFDTKQQYFVWRDALAEGLEVDGRDIVLVGSAATGRSLSARKKFGTFSSASDIDIAVVSSTHFDRAWSWFRRTDPVLLGLEPESVRLFGQHRKQYVFDGMVAANYFLSYLPFGNEWNRELQRSEKLLPSRLRGRKMSVRIYKDGEALRAAQMAALATYQGVLRVKEGIAD